MDPADESKRRTQRTEGQRSSEDAAAKQLEGVGLENFSILALSMKSNALNHTLRVDFVMIQEAVRS